MAGERPLVDEDALRDYLTKHVPVEATAAPENAVRYALERHQAGHSNETFFVAWGPHDLVLRRPPRGAFLPTAHDVLREHRILTGLATEDVPTPRPLIACDDEDVLGAPFYLMERIHGEVVRTQLPERWRSPEARGAIGHGLVDALARLHAVDWEAAGLDIGKPTGYLERQLARWQGQWDLTRPHTSKVRDVPDLETVGAHLAAELPATSRTTVVHGDYKLDNVILSGDPPGVAAILDWEMATLGDPLADLGWMLSFWRDPGDPTHDMLPVEPRFTAEEGFPRRSELIARYEERTGLAVEEITWYVAFSVWKLAILLEGSYARHLAGKTDDPFFAAMEEAVPLLARRARDIAEGKRPV